MKVVACVLLIVSTAAIARDLGQWADAPPEQREWALAQLIPGGPNAGKSCCSEADGTQVLESTRKNDGRYWITFDVVNVYAGTQRVGPLPVPPELVLQGSKYGPKVWYYFVNGEPQIRCYAPGAGI